MPTRNARHLHPARYAVQGFGRARSTLRIPGGFTLLHLPR